MKIDLQIISPIENIIHDKVDMIEIPVMDGRYGILPNHAAAFMALHAGIVQITQSGEEERWFISKGTCFIENNRCIIAVESVIDLNTLNIVSVKEELVLLTKSISDPERRQFLEAALSELIG